MKSSVEKKRAAVFLSILAPSLYLLNLLILPGLAFLILTFIYIKYKNFPVVFVQIHIRQNFYASIFSGIAIVCISTLIILMGGFSSMYSWMFMLIYAVSIHATLVLFGVLSLVKAMNHQAYVYPGLSFLSKDKLQT